MARNRIYFLSLPTSVDKAESLRHILEIQTLMWRTALTLLVGLSPFWHGEGDGTTLPRVVMDRFRLVSYNPLSTLQAGRLEEVKNFVATVAATDTVYLGHQDFREIASCPIMSAGDFKFAIVIVWGVDERGRPDLTKKIGVCGRRVDYCDDICTLSMAWKLLNHTDGRPPSATAWSLLACWVARTSRAHPGLLQVRHGLVCLFRT